MLRHPQNSRFGAAESWSLFLLASLMTIRDRFFPVAVQPRAQNNLLSGRRPRHGPAAGAAVVVRFWSGRARVRCAKDQAVRAWAPGIEHRGDPWRAGPVPAAEVVFGVGPGGRTNWSPPVVAGSLR